MADGPPAAKGDRYGRARPSTSRALPRDRIVDDSLDRVAIVNAELVSEANVRNDLEDAVLVAIGPLGHVSPEDEAAASADRARDEVDEAADLLRTDLSLWDGSAHVFSGTTLRFPG